MSSPEFRQVPSPEFDHAVKAPQLTPALNLEGQVDPSRESAVFRATAFQLPSKPDWAIDEKQPLGSQPHPVGQEENSGPRLRGETDRSEQHPQRTDVEDEFGLRSFTDEEIKQEIKDRVEQVARKWEAFGRGGRPFTDEECKEIDEQLKRKWAAEAELETRERVRHFFHTCLEFGWPKRQDAEAERLGGEIVYFNSMKRHFPAIWEEVLKAYQTDREDQDQQV